jgi:uncharacterized membrane protein YuzA (DUF378 family)
MSVKNLGLEFIAYIIVLAGGINWGLVAISNKLNIVGIFLGDGFLARLIYLVIGVSAGYLIYLKFQKKSA